MENKNNPKIAVVVPCYNEEVAIGNVIKGFRESLSEFSNTKIIVYDNNSVDSTIEIAKQAGAIVRQEERQGKGDVVRRMFRDVDADFYILVDGDATYDSSLAPSMLKLAIERQYDLVNCIRKEVDSEAYRFGHTFGNKILTKAVNMIFGNYMQDMLSGYKVLSRRFVKSFPVQSNGFDIETEIAIHALQLQCPMGYIVGNYYKRQDGSNSKLNTYRDGFKIVKLIIALFRHEKPLIFFSLIGIMLVMISLGLGIPIVIHFIETGLVPKLPTALLAVGIMIIAFLCFTIGIILDTVTKGRIENKMLAYLSHKVFDPENNGDVYEKE